MTTPGIYRVTITDPADPRLDDFRDLNHSDNRHPNAPTTPDNVAHLPSGLVITEGALVVGRLLRSRCTVRTILGFQPKLDAFLQSADACALASISEHRPVTIIETTRECLAQVAGFDMHRGLVASADRPEPQTVSEVLEGARTIIIMEGVGDLENIGAIFRSAAGLGVDAILFGASTADPYYRRSVRVSMGHVLRLPFAYLDGGARTWHHSLEEIKKHGFRLISLTPRSDAIPLWDALVDDQGCSLPRIALLVGAEGPGLTERALRATDIQARIPMAPGTDSLNVATAAAIALYERARTIAPSTDHSLSFLRER